MTDHKAVAPKHPFRSNWTEMLASREVFRDKYRTDRDPIASERLLWRAQSFRHLVHLTPDRSILEFGCGDLAFTTKLAEVTRCENPIFAATFVAESEAAQPGTARALPASVTFLRVEDIARDLGGKRFDCIVGLDVLDARDCAETLNAVEKLLVPGGQVVFFESNPWNPWLKLRRWIGRFVHNQDSRGLLSRPQLYELISEVGFIRVFAVFIPGIIMLDLSRPKAVGRGL